MKAISQSDLIKVRQERERQNRLQNTIMTADERYRELDVDVAELEVLRYAKIQQLKEKCTEAIHSGFVAGDHEYGFNDHDQMNFTQQMLLITKGWPEEDLIAWKTINSGVVEHTLEEFQEVINAAATHKFVQQQTYWQLENIVLEAETKQEIDQVNWPSK